VACRAEKACQSDGRMAWGGWRQNVEKVVRLDRGGPSKGGDPRVGFGALIVVMRRGNSRGAKGGRKVDVRKP
jgi:hypothetical protein